MQFNITTLKITDMPDLFPYADVRGGQKELLQDVEETVKTGGILLAHAPTGIGKTVAAIAPALEYALENHKTLLFLTPKHSQHAIVIDTLAGINRRHGTRITAVDIIGKRWMCQHHVEDLDSREFNEFCRSKKKDETCAYYNNVRKKGKLGEDAKETVAEINGKLMHNEEVVKKCSERKLCPYEVYMEAGKKANVIICDYFHVFSPRIREAFLGKLEKDLEDCMLIVDEAHNLPERIRSLLSLNLSDYTLKMAANEAAVLGRKNLGEDLGDAMKVLKKFARRLEEGEERYVKKEELVDAIEEKTKMEYDDLTAALDSLGEEVLKIPNRYRSYAKSIYNFLDQWKGEDIGYARILKKTKNVTLSYRCLDPAVSCKQVFDSTHSAVLMSGTLLPLNMYTKVLGLNENRVRERSYKSPFPPENKLGLIQTGLTTKYTKRSSLMYGKYATAIANTAGHIPGNMAVFHPAYHIMDSINRELVKQPMSKPMLIERKEMNKGQKKELYTRLTRLKENGGGILMGVQAGSLSEGVDYPDNMLSAVLIIGLPLEKPDLETQALIDYYDFKFQRGWDYGYIYPAMNRAMQAAGRCIRSETDKGAIILMDERYKWANYRKCLPDDFEFKVTESPEEHLKKFFGAG